MTESADFVRMELKGLMLDPSSNVPIVILRDATGEQMLPIWIGVFEANAIALRMEGVETPRPMTHDLLGATLDQLGVAVEKVAITELRDNTFFALIHLLHDGERMTLDSRPSDAIALALRLDAPIFVAVAVLEKAHSEEGPNRAIPSEEDLKELLEQLSPDDLGEYEM